MLSGVAGKLYKLIGGIIRTLKLHFNIRVLPSTKPCLCELVKACSSLQVGFQVHFLPVLIKSQNEVPEGCGHAPSGLEAAIQECLDPQFLPLQIHCRARLQNMPRLDIKKDHKCQ